MTVSKREPWKVVGLLALAGLVVAAACYAYAAFYDYTKPMSGLDTALMIVSLIFCPPQLIFAACIDCEVIGWSGLFMYSIIGVLNAALYAIIGLPFVMVRSSTK
jgi:hypothetical protein